MKLSDYILHKLKEHQCFQVIGIPGTSCAGFFNAIDRDQQVNYIVTTNELEAGYIADGYGRTTGLGAVCVSYGVGTLSLINAIGGAFTERVPIMVINGGPSQQDLDDEREYGVLFSHSTGADRTDYHLFQHLTAASEIVETGADAKEKIDRAFSKCLEEFRPAYIEIPQNLWDAELPDTSLSASFLNSETQSLNEAFIREAKSRLKAASNPVLFIGGEIQRRHLEQQAMELIDKWNIPFVTTTLSKSLISESHSNFIGCYDSDLFHRKRTFEKVDQSDCIIALGCIWGIDHKAFVKNQISNLVQVAFGKGRIGKSIDADIAVSTFLFDALKWDIPSRSAPLSEPPVAAAPHLSTSELGHSQVFLGVNEFLKMNPRVQVVLDTCLGSFPGADLEMPATKMYTANPVWLSIGHSAPAAIGAYLANHKPPIIITGDGGFQMVAQTYSTMVKYNIPAMIIVLDNSLYAIEQYLIDDSYFENEHQDPLEYVKLNPWAYEAFPKVFRGGRGFRVNHLEELKDAMNQWGHDPKPSIIACSIPAKNLPTEEQAMLAKA